MYSIGIDIGSTAAKTVVLTKTNIVHQFVIPTGWNSKETAESISRQLKGMGFDVQAENNQVVATGYGRIAVPFADKVLSEITCHGLGGSYLFGNNVTIIDIGGQDTKIITVKDGKVTDFLMNDKCSAGTGKFIEIMSNRLGVTIEELGALACTAPPLPISSMCTVFAESEVTSYIGQGIAREQIAAGIIESVTNKVASLCNRHGLMDQCYLTGGLCESKILIDYLSRKLNRKVETGTMGRYAGAIGAALWNKNM